MTTEGAYCEFCGQLVEMETVEGVDDLLRCPICKTTYDATELWTDVDDDDFDWLASDEIGEIDDEAED